MFTTTCEQAPTIKAEPGAPPLPAEVKLEPGTPPPPARPVTAAAAVDIHPVQMSGWLDMTGGVSPAWRTCFFELAGLGLAYYDREAEPRTWHGAIDLRSCSSVHFSQAADAVPGELELLAADGSSHRMRAADAAEAARWVTTLAQTAPASMCPKGALPGGSRAASSTKQPWSEAEDKQLAVLISTHGSGRWAFLARQIPGRCGKQCRERWQNHLCPNKKNNNEWTAEEEELLFALHRELGNKWAQIARRMPGRNDNAVKNHYYKRMGKYLKRGPNVNPAIAKQRLVRPGKLGGSPAARAAVAGQQRWGMGAEVQLRLELHANAKAIGSPPASPPRSPREMERAEEPRGPPPPPSPRPMVMRSGAELALELSECPTMRTQSFEESVGCNSPLMWVISARKTTSRPDAMQCMLSPIMSGRRISAAADLHKWVAAGSRSFTAARPTAGLPSLSMAGYLGLPSVDCHDMAALPDSPAFTPLEIDLDLEQCSLSRELSNALNLLDVTHMDDMDVHMD